MRGWDTEPLMRNSVSVHSSCHFNFYFLLFLLLNIFKFVLQNFSLKMLKRVNSQSKNNKVDGRGERFEDGKWEDDLRLCYEYC